jgi:hypothetical protein
MPTNISDDLSNRLNVALGSTAAGQEHAAALSKAAAVAANAASANQGTVTQTQTSLTDNTGGAVSTTLAAITAGAGYAQADATATKNAIASLAAELALVKADHAAMITLVHSLRTALVNAGVIKGSA